MASSLYLWYLIDDYVELNILKFIMAVEIQSVIAR